MPYNLGWRKYYCKKKIPWFSILLLRSHHPPATDTGCEKTTARVLAVKMIVL
jgi:hypothetical protein